MPTSPAVPERLPGFWGPAPGSAFCCNSGGKVGWQDTEDSLEHPLHGARLSAEGDVLTGHTAHTPMRLRGSST